MQRIREWEMNMNIYEKLSAIANEIGTVAKNLEIDTGKGKGYKAVSEADVLRTIKPIEHKHRVFSYPCMRNVIESGEFVTSFEVKGEKKERKQLFLRIETVYRFVDMDDPTQYIEVTTYGDGLDSGDKATGKAMTYADKYALLKAYKIVTGDDPDQEASDELLSAKVRQSHIDSTKIKVLNVRCKEANISTTKLCGYLGVASFNDITEGQFADIAKNWEAIKKKCS